MTGPDTPPQAGLRYGQRTPLMLLAALALLAGLWAGLLRLGWQLPPLSPRLPAQHGPLMVSGFLGTLISLERAVALSQNQGGRRIYYLSPLLTGLATLALFTALPPAVPRAFNQWDNEITVAQHGWRLAEAKTLLNYLKRQVQTDIEKATVLTLEGDYARQLLQWSAAERRYRQALQLSPGFLPALLSLGHLQRQTGLLEEAIASYQLALELEQTKERNRAVILNGMGLAYFNQGKLPLAHQAFEEAIHLAEQREEYHFRAHLLYNAGSLAWTQGHIDKAHVLFSQSRKAFELSGEAHELPDVDNAIGLVLEARGDWESAKRSYEAALDAYQQLGDHFGQAQVLLNLGNINALLNDYDVAGQAYQGVKELSQEANLTELHGQLLTSQAELLALQGNFSEAILLFEDALRLKASGGQVRSSKHSWLSYADTLFKAGLLDKAAAAFQQAIDLAQRQGDNRVLAHGQLGLAQLALHRERYSELEALLLAFPEVPYSEVKAELFRLHALLEINKEDQDYRVIIYSLATMLLEAQNFNAFRLEWSELFLTDLLTAMVADGQIAVATKIAQDVLEAIGRNGLRATQLEALFVNLKVQGKQENENG